MVKFLLVLLILNLAFTFSKDSHDTENVHLMFDFGNGDVEQGYVQVVPSMNYTANRGFGFLTDSVISSVKRDGDDALKSDFCTTKDPFIFAVDVPEGNYDIFVTLGDYEGNSLTTIKAESRRLMLEKISTAPGEFKKVVFTTNVRYRQIDSVTSVRLKPRELNHFNWDKRLSIEFNDQHPCICAVEILPAENPVTIFLAGNSTVTDQKDEPWASWGQMLPRFFIPQKVVVANHAESGEALKSFIGENRLKKVLTTIKSGDYLFIQFCHNDQKPQSSAYVEPYTGYKKYLKLFINKARQHGAKPVLITPMYRQTAKEENVPLIDLFKMSGDLFESLGIEGSKKAFVHFPAGSFPGQNEALNDNTHFNNYGAYELAKCVIEGIKSSDLELKKYLVDDLQTFDPNHPDSFDNWEFPISPPIMQH
ncbi:MAG: hypothetical protein P8Y99_14435 [Calditrichaceae bacterium]